MIAVKLQGRLGNQIFQYAFALSVINRINTFYVIDDTETSDIFLKYFHRLSITDFRFIRRVLLRYSKKSNLRTLRQNSEERNELFLLKIANWTYYNGFFQSVDFFNNVIDVKSRIKIRLKYRKQFYQKYGELFDAKKILAIHYRLGDYLVYGSESRGGFNATLPDSYYLNAISCIQNIEEYCVIIVTDDIENVKDRVGFVKNKLLVSDNEILDFQILMHADIVIAANSSFSWWAAYLNSKATKIFAPEFWLGFKVNKEIPSNIIPKNFVAVNVF